MSRTAFDVVRGLDLSGRTIVVTGANTGIGYPTACALASAGARVIFACRDRDRGEEAVARARAEHPGTRVEFHELDLDAFAGIKGFVQRLDAERIDALVCNAGLSLPNFQETEDGYERVVGVCHMGHFMLTRLLMPRLLTAPAPRVVVVSSESHRMDVKLDVLNFPLRPANYKPLVAYGQAKLCNVLMARSLHRRYRARGLIACALHPGTLVTTEIGRYSTVLRVLMKAVSPFTKSPAEGAATSVWAVVHEPGSEIAGQYLKECRVARSSPASNDPSLEEQMWSVSEAWLTHAGDIPPWP
jgi:WW domain-containing oxidoreductase